MGFGCSRVDMKSSRLESADAVLPVDRIHIATIQETVWRIWILHSPSRYCGAIQSRVLARGSKYAMGNDRKPGRSIDG